MSWHAQNFNSAESNDYMEQVPPGRPGTHCKALSTGKPRNVAVSHRRYGSGKAILDARTSGTSNRYGEQASTFERVWRLFTANTRSARNLAKEVRHVYMFNGGLLRKRSEPLSLTFHGIVSRSTHAPLFHTSIFVIGWISQIVPRALLTMFA